MREFNLERALAGDPVVTGSGIKIVKIANSGLSIKYPLAVWLEGREDCYSYNKDGRYIYNSDFESSDSDLFMAPKKRTVYINLYDHSFGVGKYFSYNTKDDAEKMGAEAAYEYIAIAVPVEIEE